MMLGHSGWDLETLGEAKESGGWGLASGQGQSGRIGLLKLGAARLPHTWPQGHSSRA